MTIGAKHPLGSSLRLVLVYVAIEDRTLGVCSITVDSFVSSMSCAVAIGTYLETFTEKPDKDAVNIKIRFTLLP